MILIPSFSAFPFAKFSKFGDFEWFLETTRGIQNFSVGNSSSAKMTQNDALEFTGLIFHSFYKLRLVSKAQLNLGFTKKPMFLWSDTPDFLHDDENLNENLRCIEFDYQSYLPKINYQFIRFIPFVGYSFVDYSGPENSSGFAYNSIAGGIQYFCRINTYFSHGYFISYSPMFIIQGTTLEDTLHYISYGAEIMTNTHPLALTVFFNVRKAFSQMNLFRIFETTEYRFNTVELGFSFHLNLR